jgi:hypothetical protein
MTSHLHEKSVTNHNTTQKTKQIDYSVLSCEENKVFFMSNQIKYNGKGNPLLEQGSTERLWKNKTFLPP